MNDSRTDQDLIRSYLHGEAKSLELLISRYLKAVYSFSYRYTGTKEDAEDILQDTFVKVWKNIKKFDQNRNFPAWLFTITKNTALDWLKKKRSVPFSRLDSPDEAVRFEDTLADNEPLPDELVSKNLSEASLLAAIGELNPDYRTVLLLRLNNSLTFQEIASIVDKPLDTVKSHYRRAVAELHQSEHINRNQ